MKWRRKQRSQHRNSLLRLNGVAEMGCPAPRPIPVSSRTHKEVETTLALAYGFEHQLRKAEFFPHGGFREHAKACVQEGNHEDED